MREKVRKSLNTVSFQWFGAPEGRKVGSLKRPGAEPAGQMRDEKLHAVVARSTFPSQNVQNTRGADHFWQLRCRKSACRCGAKHISKSKCTKHTILGPLWKFRCRKSVRHCGAKQISKSKCTKHTMYGPLLEVQMSKKCTPLWREAHFQVKIDKTHHIWTIFGGSDVVLRGRRKGLWALSKVSKTWVFVAFSTTTTTTLHYTTTTPSLHSTTLHSTTLHSITLNYTTLHYTTLRSTTLHYITLHYILLHSTTLHYTTLPSTTFRYLPLHSTPLHYTKLHYTEWHCTTDRQVDR